MLRRLLRGQLQRIEQGLGPINAMRPLDRQADSDRRLEHNPVADGNCRTALQRGPLT